MAETKKKSSPRKGVVSKIKNAIPRSRKNEKKETKFEDKPDLKQLFMVTAIVDVGVSKIVERLMQECGSSIQFTHNGQGTAPREILNILGVVDNKKGVVNGIFSEDHLEDIKRELSIFFAASKRNRGIAFTVRLTSIEGVRIYKYLTQTL